MIPAVAEPIVSAEVDLRDFGYMPLETVRLRDSELATKADGEVFKAAVLLWCVAWHQVPASSLPDDDIWLAARCGGEGGLKRWRRLRTAGALRGFVKCSDGRLYHPVIAAKAIEAWEAKQKQRARTIKATESRRNDARDVPRDDQRDVKRDDARNDQRDVHQGKGREGKVREIPPKPPKGPRAGFDDFWRAYPHKVGKRDAVAAFAKALDSGATLERMIAAVQRQAASPRWTKDGGQFIPHPATWLNGQRWEDAEAAGINGHGSTPTHWSETWSGIVERANQLGLEAFDEVAAHTGNGPNRRTYRQQVIDADAKQRQSA